MKIRKKDKDCRLKKQYNKIWKEYLNKDEYAKEINRHKENRQKYYDIIGKYINNGRKKRIIELGCGSCIDTNIIAERQNSQIFFATDISKYSIFLAKKINKYFKNSINVLVGDTKGLPFKSESFDIVFSQGLVEHFKNSKEIIKEQSRILKPNGILIVNVPQKFTGYTMMKKKAIKKNNWDLGWETEFSYHDLKKIGKQLHITTII